MEKQEKYSDQESLLKDSDTNCAFFTFLYIQLQWAYFLNRLLWDHPSPSPIVAMEI